ncbi:hypothetical protein BDF14DRAFT_1752881 [Spinellus fusiger]|nr:hypothetical protein BDF14DRAFT_1752881 [Spinellus fusiger]
MGGTTLLRVAGVVLQALQTRYLMGGTTLLRVAGVVLQALQTRYLMGGTTLPLRIHCTIRPIMVMINGIIKSQALTHSVCR